MARWPLVLLLGLLLAPATGRAESIFLGSPNGLDLPVPTSSEGWAFVDLHYFPESHELWVHAFEWGDLSSPLIAAHIHGYTPTGDSLVAIDVQGLAAAASGSFLHTWNLALDSTFAPDFLAAHGGTAEAARDALLFRPMSVDFHTIDFPDGEIGGPLGPFIPEPTTASGLCLGLAILGRKARRR